MDHTEKEKIRGTHKYTDGPIPSNGKGGHTDTQRTR
jgi:hypothetical protein